MEVKNIGVIFDLEKDNFLHKGFGYIKSKRKIDLEELEGGTNLAFSPSQMINFNFAFQKKVEEIATRFQKDNQLENIERENETLRDSIFEKYKGHLLDIVILPDTGLKGIDKTNITNNSILYFQLEGNISMGFLIHRELAVILFEEQYLEYMRSKTKEEEKETKKDEMKK